MGTQFIPQPGQNYTIENVKYRTACLDAESNLVKSKNISSGKQEQLWNFSQTSTGYKISNVAFPSKYVALNRTGRRPKLECQPDGPSTLIFDIQSAGSGGSDEYSISFPFQLSSSSSIDQYFLFLGRSGSLSSQRNDKVTRTNGKTPDDEYRWRIVLYSPPPPRKDFPRHVEGGIYRFTQDYSYYDEDKDYWFIAGGGMTYFPESKFFLSTYGSGDMFTIEYLPGFNGVFHLMLNSEKKYVTADTSGRMILDDGLPPVDLHLVKTSFHPRLNMQQYRIANSQGQYVISGRPTGLVFGDNEGLVLEWMLA